MIKYAANSFLAAKITFINEVANLCEVVGADVSDVAKGIGLDGRIGKKFLHAGPGYGGSCFPKDCLALVKTARDSGSPMTLIETVVEVNESRKKQMAQRVIAAAGGSVAGKTIGVLGLTFKPNTDDMRDSPSLAIIPELVAAGAMVKAYDPEGIHEAKKLLPDIGYARDAYEALEGVDCIVLMTEWNEFRGLDWGRIANRAKGRVVVDLRNIYNPQQVAASGFDYYSIGRAAVPANNIG